MLNDGAVYESAALFCVDGLSLLSDGRVGGDKPIGRKILSYGVGEGQWRHLSMPNFWPRQPDASLLLML